MNNRVKIIFPIDQDEDGYPPYSVETIWAEVIGEKKYKIDNIPFYVRNVSVGDIVLADSSALGLSYVSTTNKSDNSTLRVICYEDDAKTRLLQRLYNFGCDFEVGVPKDLVAINVPADAKVKALLEYLDAECKGDQLDYEESAARYPVK